MIRQRILTETPRTDPELSFIRCEIEVLMKIHRYKIKGVPGIFEITLKNIPLTLMLLFFL